MKNKNLILNSLDKEENLKENFIHKNGFLKGYHYEDIWDYEKLNPENVFDSKRDTTLSKISKIYEINIIALLFCILHFISFYVLLIAYFLSKEIQLLIFLIIIYIIGTFAQMATIPELFKFKTRTQFEKDIFKFLNSSAYIKMENGEKKNITALFRAKYTIDVTGELIIPKGYNYVRIKDVQIFTNGYDFRNLKNNFKDTYGFFKIVYYFIYGNEYIYIPDGFYKLNSDDNNIYSINILTTILSILLCPWILSIYYNYSKEGKCIDIYLTKMLYNNKNNKEKIPESKSKIIIHNKKYEIKPYIVNDIQSNNEEFKKDFAELQKKREEIKRKEDDLKKNTEILSQWDNKNYYIEIKKIYDFIYLTFFAYEKQKRHCFKKMLGLYDPDIKERIERSEKITTYYPRGYDIRIEVVRGINSYTVSIGDDNDEYYTENFPFYHNS